MGENSLIHTSKILRLSEALPLVIEIINTEQNIQNLLPLLDNIINKANCGGLVTLEQATIIKFFTTK